MTNKQKPTCTHLLPEKQNQTKDALPDFFLQNSFLSAARARKLFKPSFSSFSHLAIFFSLFQPRRRERRGVLMRAETKGNGGRKTRVLTTSQSHENFFPQKRLPIQVRIENASELRFNFTKNAKFEEKNRAKGPASSREEQRRAGLSKPRHNERLYENGNLFDQ
jgi:hypothetical protein